MEASSCDGCHAPDARLAEQDARIAALEEEVRQLKALLGRNASNSSTPPSANPLGAPKPVLKKKSKRRPAGQPGHPPHLKQLLPPELVNVTHKLLPRECEHCRAALPAEAAPGDPEPTRFQAVELPRVVARVTEYQGHARTCPCCAHVPRAAIPRDILAHSVGPRLTATLSYFSGCHGVSQRGVEEIAAA